MKKQKRKVNLWDSSTKKYFKIEPLNLESEPLYKWTSFRELLPKYGDLIVLQQPPEQCEMPYVTTYERDTEWIEGAKWIKLPPL